MAWSRKAWLMAAASIVLLVGCHTITEDLGLTESPTEPEAVTTTPATTVGAISIPVILPASNPAPTPAPTPPPANPETPPPAPPPEPAPPPSGGGGGGGGGCNLPSQSPSHSCSRSDGIFYNDVDEAMTRVIQNRPGLFKLNDDNCGGCPYIKDHQAYTDAVVAEMQRMGYCAFYDGEELAVKNTQQLQRAVRHLHRQGLRPPRREDLPGHLLAGLVLDRAADGPGSAGVAHEADAGFAPPTAF